MEKILRYMGGCQSYGPFLGTLNIRCRIVIYYNTLTTRPRFILGTVSNYTNKRNLWPKKELFAKSAIADCLSFPSKARQSTAGRLDSWKQLLKKLAPGI